DYISVADLHRERLARHPWSLQGGGAVELKQRIDTSTARLVSSIEAVGRTTHTAEDDAYFIDPACPLARRAPQESVPLVTGEALRDYLIASHTLSLFPYDTATGEPRDPSPALSEHFWALRTTLRERRDYGQRPEERGLRWFDHSMFFPDRYRTPLSIAFASVATHNHFVLDRGGKVFNRTAPVIKLPQGASEDDHLALLGLLNSSTACFWMKQVFYPKGGDQVGQEGARVRKTWWDERYDFDGTKLKQFPIPAGSALPWAQRLDALAQELSATLPHAVVERGTPSRGALDAARARVGEIRAEMVAVQEELDWRCLFLYGVTDEDLSLPPEGPPPLAKGERAFAIVLARRMAAGEVTSTWFERHGSTPITALPAHWPEEYRRLVERRTELIESDRFVGLVERPEHKRRWNWESWEDLEQEALRNWLLDRLEDPRYWPEPRPRSAAQLADDARTDAEFVQVAQLYAGRVDVDLTDLVSELVTDEAVPYLAAWRYTESGMRKRQAWERTWELQRREDAGEDVGTIPVPPKYTKADFATGTAWRLRGKLDVPKERFISYPGANRDTDPTPLVGWAGWDHLQAAQAL